jgi:hypothetical protein
MGLVKLSSWARILNGFAMIAEELIVQKLEEKP